MERLPAGSPQPLQVARLGLIVIEKPFASPTTHNTAGAHLLAAGYSERLRAISPFQTNLRAILTSIPLALVFPLLYYAVWGASCLCICTLNLVDIIFMPLIFTLLTLLCIPIHEFLHGLTWHFFCRNGWESIRFGMVWSALMPYCHCEEVLQYWQYAAGSLAPIMVLGVTVGLLAVATQSLFWLCVAIVNILMSGGDIAIWLMSLQYAGCLMLDHPQAGGFYAYCKEELR